MADAFTLLVGIFKGTPMLMAVAFAWLDGVTLGIGDRTNLIFNVVTAGLVIFVIIRGGKSKVKDDTIKTLQDDNQAKDELLQTRTTERDDARRQVRQIEQAAAHCRDEATKWQAKYEEQANYTAGPVLEAVLSVIEKNDQAHMAQLAATETANERRHVELMAAFETLNTSVRNGTHG